MYKFHSGFTLLELLIAVALVGLITALAIPSYRDYIVRTKISELFLAGASAKASIAATAQIRGKLQGSGAGMTIGTESQYLSAATVEDNGVITLTASAEDLGANSDVTLSFTPTMAPSGVVLWTCTSQGNPDYVPSVCR